MLMLYLLSTTGIIAGLFILLNISPLELTNNIFKSLTDKPRSIKDQINEATNKKKPNYLKREITEVQEILRMTDRTDKFPLVCSASLGFFILGAVVAVLMDNAFLIPVLAVGMMFFPFWYIKLTANHFKKDIAAELETALSIITTAYLRNEDILTAATENIDYLNPPIKNVFLEFLISMKVINADSELAIKALKSKIENEVFREWCDALAACQSDRNLKSTLTPIVSKLSDIRIVNAELDLLVFEPRKEFIIMVFLLIGNIPLMYFLNKTWYELLMFSMVGKIILAITAVVIFVSTAFVLKITKPIEFRR